MLKPGTRYCQCGACGKYFNSTGGFDKHRTGDQDHRRCLTTEEMEAIGMLVNEGGYWIRKAREDVPD